MRTQLLEVRFILGLDSAQCVDVVVGVVTRVQSFTGPSDNFREIRPYLSLPFVFDQSGQPMRQTYTQYTLSYHLEMQPDEVREIEAHHF